MVKHTDEMRVARGSFEPITLDATEVWLGGIELRNISDVDEIKLQVEIGCENTWNMDMGDLEVFIRKDHPNGEIVEWFRESCFNKADSKLTHTRTGGLAVQSYYLSVKSADSRARLVGPYALKGTFLVK